MASDTSTARCPHCAASVLPGAAWCGLCLTPIAAVPVAPAVAQMSPFAPAGAPEVGPDGSFRRAAPGPPADLFSQSRWRSGDMTFGPVGRVILTILVFLPYPLFLVNLPFGLVGVIVWSALVPRALRDIWQRARRGHLPPDLGG